MAQSRYQTLISGGSMQNMPRVKISKRETDKFMTYDSNKNRLDRISGEVYGSDDYWWLILCANPEYSMEFDIPKNTVIRIPFPLNQVLNEFDAKVITNKDR